MGSAMETNRVGIGTRDKLRDPHLASLGLGTHARDRDTALATVVDNTLANRNGTAIVRDLPQVSVADALGRAAVMDDRDKGADRSAGDRTRSVSARSA
jgi:hypothetical protein